jgi:hypothetical protein
MWNVRSLLIRFIETAERELATCKLDLVRVQEVRWYRGGTEPASDCTFACGNGNESHELGTGFVHT